MVCTVRAASSSKININCSLAPWKEIETSYRFSRLHQHFYHFSKSGYSCSVSCQSVDWQTVRQLIFPAAATNKRVAATDQLACSHLWLPVRIIDNFIIFISKILSVTRVASFYLLSKWPPVQYRHRPFQIRL